VRLRIEPGFDATHITFSTSAMRDQHPTNAMVSLSPYLGRLDIEVIETKR